MTSSSSLVANPAASDLPEPSSLFALVGRFARRHWPAYLLSAAMLAGVALLTAWVPRKVGQAVDSLVAGTMSGSGLATTLVTLLAMGVAIYLLRVGWRITLYGTAYRLGVELRTRLYARLSAQSPAFFQTRRTGDLMALATNDVDAVEMAAGEAFLAGFDGTLTLVLVVAMMSLGLDWSLTLIALLPFPAMALSFWWLSRRVHAASRQSLETFSRLNEQTQETMAGVRTVRALGLAGPVQRLFAGRAGAAADAGFAELRWESAYEPAIGLTLTTAIVLVMALGGQRVLEQTLTIGELTAFTMYLGQLIWPMFAMGWVLSLIERGRAAWARLVIVLAQPTDLPDSGTRTRRADGDLVVQGLDFSYPGQPVAALARVSLTLKAGQTLGIVGPTGAGKSTLVSLLMRQGTAQQGMITWDGTPLAHYRLAALRASIAWVPQEAFLFSASLAQNIALARPDADAGAVDEVVRLADLQDDVARFPAGLQTLVGERGVTLSGGQRQRVAIARALLAEAPLLILDDALSAVDTATEGRILGHLRDRRRSGSAIIVSHRLSAVVDADHIVVLTQGRITEAGTHAELLARGGWYARQWQYQQLAASLDAD